jgi:hypothetical protein
MPYICGFYVAIYFYPVFKLAYFIMRLCIPFFVCSFFVSSKIYATNPYFILESFFYWSDSVDRIQIYIDQYKHLAVAEMHQHRIPASIKMAQGILESGVGASELATVANNHFGIKCGSDWDGHTHYVWDDEPQKSCFRIFTSAEACYRAHSEFLLNPKKEYRYGFLFKLDIKDYKGWANGLQTSGYASSKTYATKLISLIERYSLHELDTILPESSLPMPSDNPNLLAANEPEVSAYANVMADANMVYPRMNLITTAVAAGQREKAATNQKLLADNSQKIALPRHPTEGKSPTAQEKQILSNALLAARSTTGAANKGSGRINGLDMVYAQNVEELTDIAKKQKMAYRRLLRINELQNTSLKQGQPIYLSRKLKKFHEPNAFHIVSARQTLYDVAQMYGIRTKSLRRLNKLSKGMPLAEGMRLRLS